MNQSNEAFLKIVSDVPKVGKAWHSEDIIENARRNAPYIRKTVADLPAPAGPKADKALIISAGPSLRKFDTINRIVKSGFKGTTVAVDGSMIVCLQNGIVPDYVLTLDPHPTRMVRWFGDPDAERNSAGDDYYSRQDLDVKFRENSVRQNQENIKTINEFAPGIKLIISTTSPMNVVQRAIAAGFDMYWWNPLVDDPKLPGSLTRELYGINRIPCFNTGGTVGTASWVFANSILKVRRQGVVGMDLGYHGETPISMTQTFYELQTHLGKQEIDECFVHFTFPLTGQDYYTDPTYYWYRKNFIELVERSGKTVFNCSEAGTLFAENIHCVRLEDFILER